MRFINLLLDLCREWKKVLTLEREETKEWESAISVQGGHAIHTVKNKVMILVNQEDKIHFIKDGMSNWMISFKLLRCMLVELFIVFFLI